MGFGHAIEYRGSSKHQEYGNYVRTSSSWRPEWAKPYVTNKSSKYAENTADPIGYDELTTEISKYNTVDNTAKRSLPAATKKREIKKNISKSKPRNSGFVSFASFNIFGSHKIPKSSFSCRKRVPGYYADVELGCQVSRSRYFI